MIEVHHLIAGSSQTFLNVLGSIEDDEKVCLVYLDRDNIWVGTSTKTYKIIRRITDPHEIRDTLAQFCPLFLAMKTGRLGEDSPVALTENDILWGEMMDEQNQREIEDFENEFGDDL